MTSCRSLLVFYSLNNDILQGIISQPWNSVVSVQVFCFSALAFRSCCFSLNSFALWIFQLSNFQTSNAYKFWNDALPSQILHDGYVVVAWLQNFNKKSQLCTYPVLSAHLHSPSGNKFFRDQAGSELGLRANWYAAIPVKLSPWHTIILEFARIISAVQSQDASSINQTGWLANYSSPRQNVSKRIRNSFSNIH